MKHAGAEFVAIHAGFACSINECEMELAYLISLLPAWSLLTDADLTHTPLEQPHVRLALLLSQIQKEVMQGHRSSPFRYFSHTVLTGPLSRARAASSCLNL
jgi:hypothetical protein